jgi:hypothetical protein
MSLSQILFVAHPAERQVVAAVAGSPCCSCCCCCCCCLHSIGGIVGASIGSGQSLVKTHDRDKAAFAISVYWGAFALVAVVSTLVIVVMSEPIVAFLTLILFTPVIQLMASAVALLVVAVAPLQNKGSGYAAIGWITLWSFSGSAVGLVIMILIGAVLYAFVN